MAARHEGHHDEVDGEEPHRHQRHLRAHPYDVVLGLGKTWSHDVVRLGGGTHATYLELAHREGGFYRSADGGGTWEKRSDYLSGGTGPHYYQEIFASPHRFDRVRPGTLGHGDPGDHDRFEAGGPTDQYMRRTTLTLDGQAETDFYEVHTLGSQGDQRNYVINVLDTGLEDDGVDEMTIFGLDSPNSGMPFANDDIFRLRHAGDLQKTVFEGDDFGCLRTCLDNKIGFSAKNRNHICLHFIFIGG